MLARLLKHESHWLLQLEGESTVASAVELKAALIEWVANPDPKEPCLQLDLERTGEIDISTLQLLYAAGRDAARRERRIEGRFSSAVATAIRNSGFDQTPWLAPEGPVNDQGRSHE